MSVFFTYNFYHVWPCRFLYVLTWTFRQQSISVVTETRCDAEERQFASHGPVCWVWGVTFFNMCGCAVYYFWWCKEFKSSNSYHYDHFCCSIQHHCKFQVSRRVKYQLWHLWLVSIFCIELFQILITLPPKGGSASDPRNFCDRFLGQQRSLWSSGYCRYNSGRILTTPLAHPLQKGLLMSSMFPCSKMSRKQMETVKAVGSAMSIKF